MQITGKNTLREYYENRRNETDPDLIKQYLEEGEGAITVLTEGMMQVEVTEWDKYGNPIGGGLVYVPLSLFISVPDPMCSPHSASSILQ